jgi:hypothetical protein
MGGGVDAARQAGDHHQARRQFRAERFREPHAVGRSIARPHHAHRAGREGFRVPQHRDRRRRIGQLREKGGIVRTVEEQESAAEALQGAEFGFHLGDGGDRRRSSPAAGAGEFGQRRQRLLRCGESRHQPPISDRPHAFRSDQTQAVNIGHGGNIMPFVRCAARCPSVAARCWHGASKTPERR